MPKGYLNHQQLEATKIDDRKEEALKSLLFLRAKAGSVQSPGSFQSSPAVQADQFRRGVVAARVPTNEVLGPFHKIIHKTAEFEEIFHQKEQQAELNRLKDETEERRRAKEAERMIAE